MFHEILQLRMTPLHWAVERGHLDVINCLLRWGADATVCSKFDKSPLDIAIDNDQVEVVQVLQVSYTGTAPPTKWKYTMLHPKIA